MTLSKATVEPMDQGRIDPASPMADAINTLYKHLDYPAPSHLGVCDCCVSARTTKSILSKKQRDLSREEIWEWFQGATIDDFPQEVWGFLLPRIAEILSCGLYVCGMGAEIALSRFETGNRNNWSAQQWAAIDTFQQTFLKNFRLFKDEGPVDFLCMFVCAGWPIDALTDQLLNFCDADLIDFFWSSGASDGDPIFWENEFLPKDVSLKPFVKSEVFLSRMEAVVMDDGRGPELQMRASTVFEAAMIF